MLILRLVLQIIVAVGLLNVWLLRARQQTSYRGGSPPNNREEFAAYGLPTRMMWLVGGLKVVAAFALLAGIWLPVLILPAALIVAVLMVGAVGVHLKIHDPLSKMLPAAAVLLMVLAIASLSTAPWQVRTLSQTGTR